MSDVQMYLREIKKIIPDYISPSRGRRQQVILKRLSGEEKKKFIFYENQLRLEKNRLAARKNRLKKKSINDNLLLQNKILKEKIIKLGGKIPKKIINLEREISEKKYDKLNQDSKIKEDKLNQESKIKEDKNISSTGFYNFYLKDTDKLNVSQIFNINFDSEEILEIKNY